MELQTRLRLSFYKEIAEIDTDTTFVWYSTR